MALVRAEAAGENIMPPNYQNGLNAGRREGKTDASMEAIAERLDMIWTELCAKPCTAHGEAIASNRTMLKVLWVLTSANILAWAGVLIQHLATL